MTTTASEEEQEKAQYFLIHATPRLLQTIKWINAAERQEFKTPHGIQRPSIVPFPSLRAATFWDIDQDFPWCRTLLEKNVPVFREEFLKVSQTHAKTFDHIKSSNYGGKWSAFYFINQGNVEEENCKLCPKTTAILEQIPLLMKGTCIAYTYFSVITPGTHITAHYGVSNAKLRIQLPILISKKLVLPQNEAKHTVIGNEFSAPESTCLLRVARDVRYYEEAKCLVFDDSYEHEVMYKGSEEHGERVVLLIDIWHPDLEDIEKEAAVHFLPPPPPEESKQYSA